MIEQDFILIIFCLSTLVSAFAYLFLDHLNSPTNHRYQRLKAKSQDDISIRKAVKDLVFSPKPEPQPEQTLVTTAINMIMPRQPIPPPPNPLDKLPKAIALPFKLSEKVFDLSTDFAAAGVKTMFFPVVLSYRAIKAISS